jgi:hypothetical protein
LQTDIKRQFGDEASVQITNADIVRWINEGAMEIVSKNPIIQATATTTTVSGTKNYAMPTDILQMIMVEYDSGFLTAASMEQIKEKTGTYQATTGVPQFWYMFANTVYLWPVPNAAKTLTLYYVQAPTGVASSGDLLPVPDRYYSRLRDFCMQRASELDEDTASAMAQRKLFEDKLNEMSNVENTQQGAFHVVADDTDGGYYMGNDFDVDRYY